MQPSAVAAAADISAAKKNNDGANASRTLFLGQVVNAENTRIGGTALGGLDLVNQGLPMAAAGSQATVQDRVGLVTLISTLTNNTGVLTTNTQ